MHIHIWTLVCVKDNGVSEVCWPLWVHSDPSRTKTHIFRWGLVRDSVEGSRSTPECPWIRQTGSGPARTPRPHGDSHEFPQYHWPRWLVTYSAMRHRAPREHSHKGTRGGGREAKKIILHSPSQHDPDNCRLPFFSQDQIAFVCPKLEGQKGNKKPNEKGVLQRLIRYKRDQSGSSLRNRRKSISFLFPSFLFYVWP